MAHELAKKLCSNCYAFEIGIVDKFVTGFLKERIDSLPLNPNKECIYSHFGIEKDEREEWVKKAIDVLQRGQNFGVRSVAEHLYDEMIKPREVE